MNPALAAPAGTVIVLGTFTAELPVDRFTVKPPGGAAAVSARVHASVPAPVIFPLLHDSILKVAGGAVPVPLRPITAVPLMVELLVTVSCPVAAPIAAGSNCTFNVIARPGLSVIGNETLESVNPAPASVARSTVTAVVPVEVKMTDCIADVLTRTLPKSTLAALILSVGTAACSCKVKLLETLPEVAVKVTVCPMATDETAAVKPTLAALAGTITDAGTVTADLLLDRLTFKPPLGAAVLKVRVQGSVPDPVIKPLLHETEFNTGN